MLSSSLVHDYLKRHAHALVEKGLAEYPTLSDCVAVLSLPDGAPRLVPRATAAETLKSEGYPSFLFDLDLQTINDRDELAVVGKIDGVPFADTLRSDRDDGAAPEPMAIPAFKRQAVDEALIGRIAAAIESLQARAFDQLSAITGEPEAFFIFWSIFEASPLLLVREGAKAALGKHPKWKQILPHVYTPCDDLLALVEIDGRIVPFVREASIAARRKGQN